MFERPQPHSSVPRRPSCLEQVAWASPGGIDSRSCPDTTNQLPSDGSRRSTHDSEPADLIASVWSASVGRSTPVPALADHEPPRRASSWQTDPLHPVAPPPVWPREDPLLQVAPPFVSELVRTWHDRHRPRMVVGYADDGAAFVIDFALQHVLADRRAWERLLACGELPSQGTGSFALDGPSYLCKLHPIESLIWAVGLASANLPLLGAPIAWRSARLLSRGWEQFPDLCRAPAHLHLAELASQGETTPDQLRHATRVGEGDLRAFLQAALFLRLLEWSR